MKKTVLLLCLVMALLFSGCNTKKDVDPSPTEQPQLGELKYPAYTIYMEGLVGKVRDYYSEYEFLPWMRKDLPFEECQALASMMKIPICLNGEFQWASPSENPYVLTPSGYYQQMYHLPNGKLVYYDPVENRILNISLYSKEPTEQDLKLTQNECKIIALRYLPSEVLSAPYREEIKVRTDESYGIHYTFTYTKYIDGIRTCDFVSVTVQETGRVTYIYNHGSGEIDVKRYYSLNVDYDRVDEVLREHLRPLEDSNIPYRLTDWYIMEWYGQYCLQRSIVFLHSNGEDGANVSITIPLEDIYE